MSATRAACVVATRVALLSGDCRALTVAQPFASALACGEKDVENRTWKPRQLPAVIAVHSSARLHPDAASVQELWPRCPEPGSLPRSAIVGFVYVDEAVPVAECCSRWARTDAKWCWRIAWSLGLEPVPCSGRLGLWRLDRAVTLRLLDALESWR